MKRPKTVNYEICYAIATNSKEDIGIKSDSEIKILKNSDIPIMDLNSTGSAISKYNIDSAFKVVNLISFIKDKKKVNNEEKDNEEELNLEPHELTIDDFIDDFKL